ncbi:MAG: protein translocase subunit SecD [Alphaproteobacteria bacterium]|nr:protein translocase subunit SecD [Alphaproteobacteria bacterium]
MEGSTLVRLGAILLLLLGSLYVLSPNLLDDPGAVEVDAGTVAAEAEPTLQVWFDTPDGDPDDDTVATVRTRLDVAGVAVDGVAARDGRLVVFLRTGTRKEDAERAVLSGPGRLALYDVAVLGVDLDRLRTVDDPDALLDATLAASPLPTEGEPLVVGAVRVRTADPSAPQLVLETVPEGVGRIAVAVGDTFVGSVDAVAGQSLPVRFVGEDPSASATALFAAAPLLEPLTRATAEEVEQADEEEDASEAAPEAWWVSMLPDTRLNLGLDLQGGIDLTLNVDQDAAVIASLNRDRRQLLDQAAADGKTLDVRRDRTRFALQASSAMPYDELSAWVTEKLRGEYLYVETVEEGSTRWHVWELVEQRVAEIMDQAVEQNLETLRKRVDATGVKEPSIVKMGGGRINVQLPGVSDQQQAMDALGTQAILEFRMVDEEADGNAVTRNVQQAQDALPPEQYADTELLNEWLRQQGLMPPGRMVLFDLGDVPDDETGPPSPALALQLLEDVVLTGADIDNAGVGFDQNNFPQVLLDFKPRGAQVFCEVSTANVGKRFAIILDGEIRSAPNIREAICGGRASISMGSSAGAIDDANTLALVLRSGALTAPVDIGQVRKIGSSLGADAIRDGTYGAAIGGFIIVFFMGLWYRVPGLLADVALGLNVLLVFSLLALFGATLTLPGIAGIALTIGMAVDANIIIYERIREELNLGVPSRKAVATGYDKGLSAILDANVTTAVAGIVLYSFGTGPIKGFAVTLLIGIFTTLVTALFVTRTFMEMLTRRSDARLRL